MFCFRALGIRCWVIGDRKMDTPQHTIGQGGTGEHRICDHAAEALEKIRTEEPLAAVEAWREEQG